MNVTLMQEIEDGLEAFSRNPDPLFNLIEKLDAGEELNETDVKFQRICVNFTVGTLAGYIQQIMGVELS